MDLELVSREGVRGVALLAKVLDNTLHAHGLSPSQYRLLVFLLEKPSAATALAQSLDVTRPSLTGLVDGLVAKGFVVRAPDPDDRRRVTHQISTAGRAAVHEADEALQARLGQILANVEPDEAAGSAAAALEHWRSAIIATRASEKATR
ncbi:MAG: MarR family winged helix-turn-helix transcriptional regulator [Acidimicrobiales bacterium]